MTLTTLTREASGSAPTIDADELAFADLSGAMVVSPDEVAPEHGHILPPGWFTFSIPWPGAWIVDGA